MEAALTVRIEPASELLYNMMTSLSDETLVIATSQSGETIETNKLLTVLPKNVPVWSVVNDESGRMARMEHPVFFMKAGVETRSSSKSFTNTTALLYLLAERIARVSEPVEPSQWTHLIDALEDTLAGGEAIAEQLLDHWQGLSKLQILARGPSLASAFQASLLLAEATDTFTLPIDGGTFRHGFNYLATDDLRTLVLMPDDNTTQFNSRLALQAAARGNRVAILGSGASDLPESSLRDGRLLCVPLPRVHSDLNPLVEIVLLELLTLVLATRQGHDPGLLESKVTLEE